QHHLVQQLAVVLDDKSDGFALFDGETVRGEAHAVAHLDGHCPADRLSVCRTSERSAEVVAVPGGGEGLAVWIRAVSKSALCSYCSAKQGCKYEWLHLFESSVVVCLGLLDVQR